MAQDNYNLSHMKLEVSLPRLIVILLLRINIVRCLTIIYRNDFFLDREDLKYDEISWEDIKRT